MFARMDRLPNNAFQLFDKVVSLNTVFLLKSALDMIVVWAHSLKVSCQRCLRPYYIFESLFDCQNAWPGSELGKHRPLLQCSCIIMVIYS